MKLRRFYPAGVVAEWLWIRLNCLIQQQAWVVDGHLACIHEFQGAGSWFGPEKVSPAQTPTNGSSYLRPLLAIGAAVGDVTEAHSGVQLSS